MMKKLKLSDIIFYSTGILTTVILFCIIWKSTGHWFWKSQPYCSYMLQAQSWLEGRLDLGKNYEYLELAIYEGKYFVSFPPFPSYLMLPFVFFGMNNADSIIAFAASIAGVVYAMLIARHFIKSKPLALIMALFVTIGSNWLFTATNAWVWFIAQNLAFTFSMMAVYYALKGKVGFSLTFWSFAVGCRPFQAIYIILLAYLLYKAKKEENPDDTFLVMIKRNWYCYIAPLVVAISYMTLNYMRFGSITEFGHNYLPEFMRVSTGQFNPEYLKNNFPKLWRLPIQDGRLYFQVAEGFCIFIASPIFISYVYYTVKGLIKSDKKSLLGMILVLVVLHLVFICLHRTMGGSHIGNRYTNDVLPFAFIALASQVNSKSKLSYINTIPFIIGLGLNILWNISFFTNNIPWK